MIRNVLSSVFLLALILAGSSMAAPSVRANSFADCTNNANVCTDGTKCYSFATNVFTGSGTDTTPIGRCLLSTQYDVIQQQIAARGTGGSTSGGGAYSGPTPQPTPDPTPDSGTGITKLSNPLKYPDLDSLLTAVLTALIRIGSIFLTLALVLVGFKFVAARGNEEKIRSARTALMWTVIGGLILLGATAIQAVITTTVGAITAV